MPCKLSNLTYIGLLSIIGKVVEKTHMSCSNSSDMGGGLLCFRPRGQYARAGHWRSPKRMINISYLKHRPTCAALWSRHHLRSTSLSLGYPCESLCRSHSWRWSGCSPDRPSERVRPGQPWLRVCHKTVRITFPNRRKSVLIRPRTRRPTSFPLRTVQPTACLPSGECSEQASFFVRPWGTDRPFAVKIPVALKCRSSAKRVRVPSMSRACVPRLLQFLHWAPFEPTCCYRTLNLRVHTGLWPLTTMMSEPRA